MAFLVTLALVPVVLVAGRLNSVGCYFGSVVSFVGLFGFLLCHLVSFEPIYWPFVGGLVGTVSNLHLDTGLLQLFLLT